MLKKIVLNGIKIYIWFSKTTLNVLFNEKILNEKCFFFSFL